MPTVDLVDETFVVADRAVLASVVADPARWRVWWPDLEVTVFMDRGLDGVRWSARGAWVGSVEIWLEQHGDGVLVHHYQRLDPLDPRTGDPRREPSDLAGWRRAARERDRRARAWKRHVWALKDEMESGRRPGEPRHVPTTDADADDTTPGTTDADAVAASMPTPRAADADGTASVQVTGLDAAPAGAAPDQGRAGGH